MRRKLLGVERWYKASQVLVKELESLRREVEMEEIDDLIEYLVTIEQAADKTMHEMRGESMGINDFLGDFKKDMLEEKKPIISKKLKQISKKVSPDYKLKLLVSCALSYELYKIPPEDIFLHLKKGIKRKRYEGYVLDTDVLKEIAEYVPANIKTKGELEAEIKAIEKYNMNTKNVYKSAQVDIKESEKIEEKKGANKKLNEAIEKLKFIAEYNQERKVMKALGRAMAHNPKEYKESEFLESRDFCDGLIDYYIEKKDNLNSYGAKNAIEILKHYLIKFGDELNKEEHDRVLAYGEEFDSICDKRFEKELKEKKYKKALRTLDKKEVYKKVLSNVLR